MASLAEILAARKAKTEQANQEAVASTFSVEKGMPSTSQIVEAIKKIEAEEKKEVVKEVEPSDLDRLLDAPLGKVDSFIAEEAAIVTADIVPRIRQLNSLSDMEAESEMKLLKAALMANPEAVALMLPEDVGELVVCLRRITKESILAIAEGKAKKPAKEKVDKAAMLNLTADDF